MSYMCGRLGLQLVAYFWEAMPTSRGNSSWRRSVKESRLLKALPDPCSFSLFFPPGEVWIASATSLPPQCLTISVAWINRTKDNVLKCLKPPFECQVSHPQGWESRIMGAMFPLIFVSCSSDWMVHMAPKKSPCRGSQSGNNGGLDLWSTSEGSANLEDEYP